MDEHHHDDNGNTREFSLKRFLLQLPTNANFDFTKDVRKQIRKALFLSISNNGTYLNWLFLNSFTDRAYTRDDMLEKIEREYDWTFNNYYKSLVSKTNLQHNTHNHRAFHKNLPCGRIFRKGEPIHRCLTCGFDDTCALCSHCYQPEYHEGHKVHIGICQRENGGVCDCGDPEAWTRDLFCPYANVVEDDDEVPIYDRELPEDLAASILATIAAILDYMVDVIVQCDLQFEDPEETTAATIELNTINSTLDPRKYECFDPGFVDANNDQYYLMLYNDQIRYYRDAVQRVHLASKKVKDFAIMVTDKVQKFGKAKVISSRNIKLLLERQKILSSTGLATCIRSHRDVFREDMLDEIVVWLNDFTESELFKTNTMAKNLFCRAFCEKWQNGLLVAGKSDESYTYRIGTLDPTLKIPKIPSRERNEDSHWLFNTSKWKLDEDLCRECDYNLDMSEYQRNVSHHGSRLQYLIYLDVRLWKATRALLHDMYSTSLIINLHYKNIICYQYVDIYPTIVDMYLIMDREPELSIMPTLSTQLFTCPTNSAEILKHGDLTRILSSIYSFLTTGSIRSPEDIDVTHQVSIKSLKNRRWGQIFFDISYILTRSKNSKFIPNSNVVPMTCDMLLLFQGRPVMKREKTNHVEYESPDYTAFFQAVLVLYQFGEVIASALKTTRETDSLGILRNYQLAIQYVLTFLCRLENKELPGLVDNEVDINMHTERMFLKEPYTGELIQVSRVDEDKVSFLHPAHSFLGWLIEFAKFSEISQLVEVFDNVKKVYPPSQFGSLEVSLFDYPIKTIVLMSQIKAGFWVRNGFSVKSQLQLYKNTSLRDYGYARDLFLIQVFANFSHPDVVTFLILNRWILLDNWLENPESNTYDEKTLPYMLEECLNFFIHLLTEDIHLKGDDEETLLKIKVQREIMHNLCFGPMGYTKLCAQMPDHIVADRRFEIILKEMTTFKAPKGSNDFGVYYLKNEYLDEVNPYYCHYTANIKDDAIKFVKERISKRICKPVGDIIIEPKQLNPEELGIYRYIGNFSTSLHFNHFIIKTLIYICDNQTEVESLLETVLHLIHVCSLEQTVDVGKYGQFSDKFFNVSETFHMSIASLLYQILLKEEHKSTHTKIRSIFKILIQRDPEVLSIMQTQRQDFDLKVVELDADKINHEDEAGKKKRIAKERQAKLMAKFKKQQSLFIKKNLYENLECDSDIEMENYSDDHAAWKFPESHCMLCQNAAQDAGPFGIITYISKSSEFRNIPFDDEYWFLKAFSDNVDLNSHENDVEGGPLLHNNPPTEKWNSFMRQTSNQSVIGPGFNLNDYVESHVVSLSCGHGMHYQCYLNYLNNSRNRQNQITRNTPENVDRREFLCPLCKALNNIFIPLLWSGNDRSLLEFLKPHSGKNTFADLEISHAKNKDWVDTLATVSEQELDSTSILTNIGKEMISSMDPAREFSAEQRHFRVLLNNMFQVLSLFTFPQIVKADSSFILVDTIKSIEISLRGVSTDRKLIIHQLSNNALINLRTLNEFKNSSILMKVKNWSDLPNPRTDAYAKIFAHIFALSKSSINNSILEADFFHCLASVLPLPTLGFSFNCILEATFVGHLIQSLNIIVKEISENCLKKNWAYTILDVPTIADIPQNVADDVIACFKKLWVFNDIANVSVIEDKRFGEVIYSMLVRVATPFLRRAAVYAYVQCANIDNIDFTLYPETEIEADRLCTFLNIKPVCDYLRAFNDHESCESRIFHDFINFSNNVSKTKNTLHMRKELEYPGIVRLVELPERLDFFFTKYYYLDKHNNPSMAIEDPAICLFCGDVVDVQKQDIGCREGQCTTHYLKECANDVGIFLLPKDRSLLLLHKNGGSFYNAPFLDEHGEIADESKKSKALHLMKPRYDDFMRNVWLQHNVQNCIVRNLENVLDPGGWETL
ncbi:E3 ubiquitin-protein ligase ubr1 [Candida viswanathii]|uniref:E3 ubiquitin-protein ligase n=1 Tax=Candida viswanathii TaxID=5486 RepID=A0A367Y139_9ASCO|nr:E3 ubiquitin-protein ligase ubr1 [Candida viswanathii]